MKEDRTKKERRKWKRMKEANERKRKEKETLIKARTR